MTILALALPFVPGLLWLWFFYSRDKVQPEPKKVVLLTFLLGGLAAAPAVLGELAVEAFAPLTREIQLAVLAEGRVPTAKLAALCFLVIGPIEEVCKFAAVRLYAARHKAFDEPLDGIVYASAAALGFASVENVIYVLSLESIQAGTGFATLALRAVLAVPGHVFFASFWGFALGRRLLPGAPRGLVPLLVAAGAAVHGAWNFALIQPGVRVLFVVLFAALTVTLVRFIRWGRAHSPQEPPPPVPQDPPPPVLTPPA